MTRLRWLSTIYAQQKSKNENFIDNSILLVFLLILVNPLPIDSDVLRKLIDNIICDAV